MDDDQSAGGQASGEIYVGGPIRGLGIAVGHGARSEVSIYQGPDYSRLAYRDEIDYLLRPYTRTFVGRQDDWNRLVAFTGEPQGGYLLVQGPAGYGKSALMAQLIHRHETGRWPQHPAPALIYYFIRQEGKRSSPVAFLQAVNSQLLELLDAPGGVPPELTALRTQFSQLWSGFVRAAGPEIRIVMLIDGLDEMAQGEVTIADLLPTNLAPYVHVIVSSRPQPDPQKLVAPEHPLRDAALWHLNAFDEEAVKALLIEHGLAKDKASALSGRVWKMTRGEPLFARFVSEEVAESGEAALVYLEKQPPKDVLEYFEQQLDKLKSFAKVKLTRQVLGLLLSTLGGMTLEEVADALDEDLLDVEEASIPIRRFLIGDQRLRLMHDQFRQVVEGLFRRRERRVFTHLLLDWCQVYEREHWPDDTPDYVLTYYADHLHASRKFEKLYDVVLNEAFRRAQQKSRRLGTALDDLRLALSVALDSDDFPRIVSCAGAYRETVRSQSISQAIFEAVDSGQIEQALEMAEVYGKNPWAQALHLYLAWEAAESGLADHCLSAVVTARSLPGLHEGEFSEALLVRIARTQFGKEANRTLFELFGRGEDMEFLLDQYRSVGLSSEAEVKAALAELDSVVYGLEQSVVQGDDERIFDVVSLEGMAEEAPHHVRAFRQSFLQVAADARGQDVIRRALDPVLANPYGRYRDIGLVEFGIIIAAVPDAAWSRESLRRILQVALDLEGVNYTFDLAFLLVGEADRRALTGQEALQEYCGRALDSRDRWGTSLRAFSALASLVHWQGAKQEALEKLSSASQEPGGYAGLASVHLLALANRWLQFGHPDRATTEGNLLQQADDRAGNVRAPEFRQERLHLVAAFQDWWSRGTPSPDTGLQVLSELVARDERLAFIDHLSARWSWPPAAPKWQGLKELVLRALGDGTTIDAVLARLVGLYLSRPTDYPIKDKDLAEAIEICQKSLATRKL